MNAPASRFKDVKQSSQGGLVIWHGMRLRELFQLLKSRPAVSWSRWNRLALLPGMACYNSAMSMLENLVYGRAIEKTKLTAPPVFVLGFWRSGTTLLHGLLSRDTQCVSPGLYQTLFPWHFLLTENVVTRATSWLLPKSRPMDNVPIAWDCPQEDEIALCIMTLLSPYVFMATPEDFNEFWRTLDPNHLSDDEQQRWKDCLLHLMKKITLRHQRRLIMKSPSHTYRIQTLLEMFPDAKFVYIYRNPYDVFRSGVHLRKTMIRENGLGRPVFKDVERQILLSYQACFEAYERDRNLIPAGNLHEVRFEDLEQDPVGEMSQVYDRLGLPGFDQLRQTLQAEEGQLKKYRKNVFDDDPYWAAEVAVQLREAFRRYGYPMMDHSNAAADEALEHQAELLQVQKVSIQRN